MAKPGSSQQSGDSFKMGNVGAGARVAQGKNISWSEGLAKQPGGVELSRQIEALLQSIQKDANLDETSRSLASEKVQAVASALGDPDISENTIQKVLTDAQGYLVSSAQWVWNGLHNALTSDAGQKVIGSIAAAGAKAAIGTFLGMPM